MCVVSRKVKTYKLCCIENIHHFAAELNRLSATDNICNRANIFSLTTTPHTILKILHTSASQRASLSRTSATTNTHTSLIIAPLSTKWGVSCNSKCNYHANRAHSQHVVFFMHYFMRQHSDSLNVCNCNCAGVTRDAFFRHRSVSSESRIVCTQRVEHVWCVLMKESCIQIRRQTCKHTIPREMCALA